MRSPRYALPVDGALEVNGQLDFNILHSGMRKLRIKVPADSASNFISTARR